MYMYELVKKMYAVKSFMVWKIDEQKSREIENIKAVSLPVLI
jgi:hypothetical protein